MLQTEGMTQFMRHCPGNIFLIIKKYITKNKTWSVVSPGHTADKRGSANISELVHHIISKNTTHPLCRCSSLVVLFVPGYFDKKSTVIFRDALKNIIFH